MEWWRTKIRITCVNRRASAQGHMRERRTAVVLQRTEQRIDVDLIAGTVQQTATVVAADVVSTRGNGAINIPRRIRIEDCISDFNCSTADAAASGSRVAADCAVSNLHP
jgi:hypothetical protein